MIHLSYVTNPFGFQVQNYCRNKYGCLVAKWCWTLCDPMDCRMPGSSVLYCLPKLAQTHVHWVGDVILPSHPLSSPSPLSFNLSQHQGLFSESALCIRWPKYWSFNFTISPSSEYSGLISFRIDWLDLLAVKGLSTAFSNNAVQKHQFFSAKPSLWPNSHIHTWLRENP